MIIPTCDKCGLKFSIFQDIKICPDCGPTLSPYQRGEIIATKKFNRFKRKLLKILKSK